MLISAYFEPLRFRAGAAAGLAEMESVSLKAGRRFTPTEWAIFKESYMLYRCASSHLAHDAISKSMPRWRQRPKTHMLEHLTYDWGGCNPRYMANYLDEDFVRRAKKIAVVSHPRFVAKHVLSRYSIDSTLRWTGMSLQ